MQESDGRWGVGTPWGRTAYDFKHRTARDAESWEVAEVGLALLAAYRHLGVTSARAPARRAARYLARSVVRHRGRPYLAHMPDCNLQLQPHSTMAAAAFLSHFRAHRAKARALRGSGLAMRWRRIAPRPGRHSLRGARWGTVINDYERVQVGYYLTLLKHPRGGQILKRYPVGRKANYYRAQPYLVVVDSLRGRHGAAQRRAATLHRFEPRRGYDWALRDWIDEVRHEP